MRCTVYRRVGCLLILSYGPLYLHTRRGMRWRPQHSAMRLYPRKAVSECPRMSGMEVGARKICQTSRKELVKNGFMLRYSTHGVEN